MAMNGSTSVVKSQAKKVVLVLGMHRSGTSAMTAGIQRALGVNLGQVRQDSVEDNPKGNHENSAIWRINDAILGQLHTTWEGYPFAEKANLEAEGLSRYRADVRRLLEEQYSDFTLWGFKDPRLSLLLPLWKSALEESGATIYRIVALRNPLEVALSLRTRSERHPESCLLAGGDLRYALNLWYWYNLRLLNAVSDDNNIVVGFDELLSDPSGEMKRVARFLGVDPDPKGLEEYRDGFLEKQLKHHNIDPAETERFQDDHGYAFELHRRMKQYTAKDCLTRDLARGLLDGLPDDDLLQNWASPIAGRLHSMRQEVLKGRREIADWRRRVAARDGEIEERGRRITERDEQVALRDREIADRDRQIAQRDGLIADRDALLSEKDEAMAAYRAELERVYASRFWRLTAMLRRVGGRSHGGKIRN